jgi:hexosaminidase
MPGHSTAWLVAYPELASGRAPSGIRREFGISDYALDPTRKETYSFLDRFLTEMSTIFPDQFVHIGGDETPAPDWKQDPRIQAFMQAHELQDNAALQAYFNQRVLKILTRLHKSMVGWDEVFNPALPKDVVVQSWRGEASLAKGAQSGYRGLLSAPYYLDSMKPASVHYLADPIPADTSLTPAEQRLILGGEICAWGEQLNQYSIDSRIWPRTAAIAERFWSPQNLRDVDDMYRRLDTVSIELEGLGLQHLTTEDVQLRSLAGSEKIAALRIFASAFEPANFDQRVKQQHPTQLTPMTSFVDAVRPDPPVRHEIEMAVKEFLKDPVSSSAESAEARKTLQQFFASLAQSVPEVESAITSAPRLQTLRPRVEQLSHLAVIGEEAIDDLSNDKSAPPKWKHQSLAQIDADRGALGMVRFDFLQPLTDLVNATHQ